MPRTRAHFIRTLRRTLVAITFLAATGCSHPPPPVSPAAVKQVPPGKYFDVYTQWTRSDELFTVQSMNDILHATATWEALPFRVAYIERYSKDYALPAANKADLLAGAQTESANEQRFFVTVSGDEYRETDLTNKRTAWQLVLLDSNNKAVRPLRIEKIAKPTPALRTYFPSISPYRQSFRAYFPAHLAGGKPFPTTGAHALILRFTGALGTIDLTWKLK